MDGASSRTSKPTLGEPKPRNLSGFLGLTHSTTNSNRFGLFNLSTLFGVQDLNPTTQAGFKFPTPVGGTEAPYSESGLGF